MDTYLATFLNINVRLILDSEQDFRKIEKNVYLKFSFQNFKTRLPSPWRFEYVDYILSQFEFGVFLFLDWLLYQV